MTNINGIQKRINIRRKLAGDLLALAEGLRIKNNYSDLPKVNTQTLTEGYAILNCGNTVSRSFQMSAYILRSDDLRGFIEVNRRYHPQAEQFIRKVGNPIRAAACVRITFDLQEEP